MAFPFKTGGDFYNCEAQRMRLHNLGANPTETATGLMYFNTGASNLGKHAVVHDGTNFKALAFVDEIATNAEFVELKEKVDLLIGDDVDMDGIIESWKEVEAFLAGMKDTENLMDLLNSKADKTQLANYLPLSGGTLESGATGVLKIKSSAAMSALYFANGSSQGGYFGVDGDGSFFLTDTSWTANWNLIHSGNIGSYKAGGLQTSAGGDAVTIDSSKNAYFENIIYGKSQPIVFKNGNDNVAYFGAAHSTISSTLDGVGIMARGTRGIYFSTNGSVQAIINSSGNVTIGDDDLAGTSAKLLVGGNAVIGGAITVDKKDTLLSLYSLTEAGIMLQSDGSGGDVAAIYEHKGAGNGLTFAESSRDFIWRTGTDAYKGGGAGTERMRLTNSGNVLIGTTEDSGAKLQVNGNYRSISAYKQTEQIEHSVLIYPENPFGLITRISTKGYASLQSQRENGSETFNLALNPLGGNVLIGTTTELKSGAKLQIKGDVYVDGNIIATKESSAGGAGQEGESGDGGAEVIDKELAKGQSSYTIPNTIGRSAVAVSLYEWNANNSSWDMCLADISVKDATITVTFGSATSVNHKLVAVG